MTLILMAAMVKMGASDAGTPVSTGTATLPTLGAGK